MLDTVLLIVFSMIGFGQRAGVRRGAARRTAPDR